MTKNFVLTDIAGEHLRLKDGWWLLVAVYIPSDRRRLQSFATKAEAEAERDALRRAGRHTKAPR